MRAACGCLKRRDAEREGLDGPALDAMLETASSFSRDWGCPVAGCAPHTPSRQLSILAEHTARVVGLSETPTTCPFAALMHADPWVAELTRAAAIAETYHTPLPQVLGRELTPADLDALDAVIRAKADAWQSDQMIMEREREAKRPKG